MCKGEVGMVRNGFELLKKEDSGDLAYWWLCGCEIVVFGRVGKEKVYIVCLLLRKRFSLHWSFI